MNCLSRSELRRAEHLFGRALLLDASVVQIDDVARHLAGELHLMRDQDHRAALARQVADHPQHLAHQFRVERRGRLVEQHDTRLDGERAGDGGALLLAARQERRIDVALFGQARRAPAAARPSSIASFALDAQHMHRHLDDVLDERHVAPQIEALEHHAEPRADALDLAPVGRHRVAVAVGLQPDLLAIDPDQPAGRVLQAVDAAQKRRLARAAAADDGHHLAVARRQRHALQHVQLAEFLVQVLDMNGLGGVVRHRVTFRRILAVHDGRAASWPLPRRLRQSAVHTTLRVFLAPSMDRGRRGASTRRLPALLGSPLRHLRRCYASV